MKKPLFALTLLALAAGAHSAILVTNGEVVDVTGLSVLPAGNLNLGFSSNSRTQIILADDFLVGGDSPWVVDSLEFFGYQTDASVFSFSSVTWSLVLGDVNAGRVVASGTNNVTDGGFLGYRVTDEDRGSTRRAIYSIQADVPDFQLAAGHYWLRWQLLGDELLPGPFVAPTSDGQSGNAMKSDSGGEFLALEDSSSHQQANLPFSVYGTVTVVPEPATYAMLALGLVGVLAAARRRKA